MHQRKLSQSMVVRGLTLHTAFIQHVREKEQPHLQSGGYIFFSLSFCFFSTWQPLGLSCYRSPSLWVLSSVFSVAHQLIGPSHLSKVKVQKEEEEGPGISWDMVEACCTRPPAHSWWLIKEGTDKRPADDKIQMTWHLPFFRARGRSMDQLSHKRDHVRLVSCPYLQDKIKKEKADGDEKKKDRETFSWLAPMPQHTMCYKLESFLQ